MYRFAAALIIATGLMACSVEKTPEGDSVAPDAGVEDGGVLRDVKPALAGAGAGGASGRLAEAGSGGTRSPASAGASGSSGRNSGASGSGGRSWSTAGAGGSAGRSSGGAGAPASVVRAGSPAAVGGAGGGGQLAPPAAGSASDDDAGVDPSPPECTSRPCLCTQLCTHIAALSCSDPQCAANCNYPSPDACKPALLALLICEVALPESAYSCEDGSYLITGCDDEAAALDECLSTH